MESLIYGENAAKYEGQRRVLCNFSKRSLYECLFILLNASKLYFQTTKFFWATWYWLSVTTTNVYCAMFAKGYYWISCHKRMAIKNSKLEDPNGGKDSYHSVMWCFFYYFLILVIKFIYCSFILETGCEIKKFKKCPIFQISF